MLCTHSVVFARRWHFACIRSPPGDPRAECTRIVLPGGDPPANFQLVRGCVEGENCMQDAIPEACAKAARTAILFLAVLALISQPAKAIDVLTYHNDNARTGQNLSETVLQPGNVNSNSFGRLFTLAVDGKVDAQPLYASAVSVPGNGIHNLLIVATEHDSVYAFDADNGTAIWHVMTPKAGETASDPRNCTDVYPEIGITSTPVIDRTRGPNGAVY